MITIGITGGIGSGKSTVARLFGAFGCVVSDSDADARAALRDPAIRDELVRWWGDRVLDDDGAIDRRAVASIVFADPAERKRLEGLTHPWIEQRRLERFAAAPPGTRALIIDAPLLMEAGLDRHCDAIVFVETDTAVRAARVAASRGWDAGELARREDAQMPLDAKRSAADHTVVNTGDLDELREQVRLTLNKIIPPDPSPSTT